MVVISIYTSRPLKGLSMTKESKKEEGNELAKAKAKLVAELLSQDEQNNVSGGYTNEFEDTAHDGPHWREFTKFVMAPT